MKFALPILAADGREFADARALDALLSGETSGHYLLGNHRKWHGGIHISDASAPWCRDKHPVRAMADGKVVAFRMLDHYLSSEFQGEALRYSNCFCLIEHHYCETNPETQAKNEFTFYSLYMHLKPWQPEQDGERLVLKKRWNVRNSVPHHQPDADQQKADAKLPATPLPAGTELEPVAQCEPVWGTVSGKDYRFIKVSITSALSPEVQTAGAQAGVLLTQGSQVWIAEDDTALERIKPSQPLWLFDEIDAELTCDLEGHADPQFNGPTGKLLAGGYNTSLPSGTQVQYDAHRLEFHWLDGKARKMARCHYRTPAQGSQPERTGVAWVCVEESNIRIRHQRPTHLNQLYVLPSPVAISAGETVGFLGLMENPASSLGGKQGKYQVHLELFTQDPRLDGVLANQANTAGGTRYARVPAGLTLYQKRDNQWVATTAKSQAALLTAPRVEQSGDKCWLCVKEGAYVAKEQAEMLSQHDWLKLGFKKVDGSGSDGYLDPQQAPAFFEELVHCLDTNQDGHLSSEEITAALCHIEPILHSPQSRTRLQKLIVRHPSEWYDKSAGASHQWLDKLKAQVAKPEFDQLVEHEKQRIDQLEWMQSATSLKLSRDIWHFWPLGMIDNKGDNEDTICFETTGGIYRISKESAEFMIRWEGFKNTPYVPGESSGITLGYGYDLGYQNPEDVRNTLTGLYSENQITRLLTVTGIIQNEARRRLGELSDIVISQENAMTLFLKSKKRYAQLTVDIYPQILNLHPHCQGAILSLIYNRGNSLSRPNEESRREMKYIQNDFSAGSYDKIPDHIRDMKRLWPNTNGLKDRRDGEAILFEKGLRN